MPKTWGDATAGTLSPRRGGGRRAGVEAFEDLRRRARGVEPPRDDLVEQRRELAVLADGFLEARAQPEGAQREHLAAQVSPAALGQRALRLDEGAVLVE